MVSEEDKAKTELEKPPIKAVIFDFDGLLVDTEPVWDKTYYVFLKNHNIVPNEEVEDQMFGSGLTEAVQLMIDKMGLKGGISELVSDYRKLFYEEFLKRKDVVMPGAMQLLRTLQDKDVIISLTFGGHTKLKLMEILKSHGILDFFTAIVSSDDVAHGKPAPDVYIEACRELQLRLEFCIALEDSPNGIEAAKAAGVRVYGVNKDEKIRAELARVGADRVFSSLNEVDL